MFKILKEKCLLEYKFCSRFVKRVYIGYANFHTLARQIDLGI